MLAPWPVFTWFSQKVSLLTTDQVQHFNFGDQTRTVISCDLTINLIYLLPPFLFDQLVIFSPTYLNWTYHFHIYCPHPILIHIFNCFLFFSFFKRADSFELDFGVFPDIPITLVKFFFGLVFSFLLPV